MKLPKIFRPEKKLEKKVNEMIKINPLALKKLQESCKEFVKRTTIPTHYGGSLASNYMEQGKAYKLAKQFAQKIKYGKDELEALNEKLGLRKDDFMLGLYFSALVNKIIKEKEEIETGFDEELDYLGAYMKKGTFIIKSPAGLFAGWKMIDGQLLIKNHAESDAGFEMQGGELIIEGNAGDSLGSCMEKGKIIVYGNAGNKTGEFMKGGEIHVEGEIDYIDKSCSGKIYQKGKRVWL